MALALKSTAGRERLRRRSGGNISASQGDGVRQGVERTSGTRAGTPSQQTRRMREFASRPWLGRFAVDGEADTGEAVFKEFEAISERGGVLGAMDAMYQRGKIQDESMYYEHRKHDGSLTRMGVNTSLPKQGGGELATEIELLRSTEERKASGSPTPKPGRPAATARRPKAIRHGRNAGSE